MVWQVVSGPWGEGTDPIRRQLKQSGSPSLGPSLLHPTVRFLLTSLRLPLFSIPPRNAGDDGSGGDGEKESCPLPSSNLHSNGNGWDSFPHLSLCKLNDATVSYTIEFAQRWMCYKPFQVLASNSCILETLLFDTDIGQDFKTVLLKKTKSSKNSDSILNKLLHEVQKAAECN